MRKTDSMKEALLLKKIKTDDPVELPMDDLFFDNLHNKIMCAVEKTEIKPASKWQKSWVFLEQQTRRHRGKAKKAAKLGIAAVTLASGVNFLNVSLSFYRQARASENNVTNVILTEAQKNPVEWSELVSNYQNENDFYAELLSQKDVATLAQIDKNLVGSL